MFFSRLLKVWIFGDVGFDRKWLKKDVIEINGLLRDLNKHKPREIHRSVRSLDHIKFWKGTEFRSFLLYFGMVVLKDYLPQDVYRHFLILMCATTICYTDTYQSYLPMSKIWFDRYVEHYMNIYSIHSVGSNVHLLTHVYDDVKLFGNLNDISAYPFESRLNFLKLRLKQPNLPLEQITRRIIELSLDYDQLYSCNMENEIYPQLKHSDVLDETEIYKEVVIDSGFTLSSIRLADRFFLTFSLEIIQMSHVVSTENGISIFGTEILNRDNFFTYPISSTKLNIFKSDSISPGLLSSFNLNDIKAKMVRLTSGDDFVFMPLLHTLK